MLNWTTYLAKPRRESRDGALAPIPLKLQQLICVYQFMIPSPLVGEGQGGGRSSRGPRPSECAGICLPPPQPSPTRGEGNRKELRAVARRTRPLDFRGQPAPQRRSVVRAIGRSPHVKTFPTARDGYTDSPRVAPVSWTKEVPRSAAKAIGAVGQDRGRRAQMGRVFGALGDIDNPTRPRNVGGSAWARYRGRWRYRRKKHEPGPFRLPPVRRERWRSTKVSLNHSWVR
jgi:hypothetical protein